MREQQQPAPPASAPAPVVPQAVPDQLSAEAKHLRDFRKYNPMTVDGSLEDPTMAQMWLSSLETIFRYMKCPEDKKVQCAVFMLTDRGTAWWKMKERMLGGDVGQITWEQFKESFYWKFFSASLRDAKCHNRNFLTRLCSTCLARSTSQPFKIQNLRTNLRYDVASLHLELFGLLHPRFKVFTMFSACYLYEGLLPLHQKFMYLPRGPSTSPYSVSKDFLDFSVFLQVQVDR
ncbi:gag-protease polyprotein [Cucumis melo var. makuwa]|uniref:Gag-protease polyprotein n=1 Tax=Cucumis melo var. makuwa TaxID=1194695 RepID=A0A5D3BUF7_CUCMM|nr:gag-protease polyprotein [Cucumis melo var. makuwa]TYK03371.1 gag-protease polyprotein [Cucumis melo var. makuwa]